MAKFLQVGSIRMSKANKLYINLNQTPDKTGNYVSDNLKELQRALNAFIADPQKGGVSLQIEKPQDKIKKLADLGYIEEDQVEKRLASIPDYIKYEIAFVKED